MEDIFITNIHIEKVRNLSDFDIELSLTEKKHLILTGKNGSGKTSLLEEIKNYIKKFEPKFIGESGLAIKVIKTINDKPPNLSLKCNQEKFDFENMLSAYIPAKRFLNMENPTNIEKINIKSNSSIDKDLSRDFLKYIIYLDYQRLGAESSKDNQHLQKWFERFESALKDIYDCNELQLEPVRKDLLFKIKMPGIEPFGLNEMADGYSAFLDIIIELILRMDNGNAVVDTDLPGIVLIDEIETHLHVELQKKVLPFLTKMFPNIQFIVSTHSPFVISSIKNAVIFDLENKRRTEDLSEYSWETIVESYFDVNQYSHKIENKFNRYKELCSKEQRERAEEKEFSKLRAELSLVSPAQKELYNAFQQLESRRKAAKSNG